MSTLGNFVWSIADQLRGVYKPHQYGNVILPFTILRRLDCLMEPHRGVMRSLAEKHDNPVRLGIEVKKATGLTFYNTSAYQFSNLLAEPDSLRVNLHDYLERFSGQIDVFERFKFANEIATLEEKNRLYLVVSKFSDVDLHPDALPNAEMGDLFEELIRKFAEASNEEAGEHYTPRDAIRLMVDLLFAEKDNDLTEAGVVRSIYDPTAGTGGMLSVAEEHLLSQNPQARIVLYGQEHNDQSYAICKSDMIAKGQDPSNIRLGDTLAEDLFGDRKFDFCMSNPPYGVDWKVSEAAVKAERAAAGEHGRFAPGLPKISDGQMLFLTHLASKMRPAHEGGGRAGIVMSGSPFFNGNAGQGESEIRRWLFENDLVEAIVALPKDMFFNTALPTFIWILDNTKRPERRGKVQLIDGSGFSRRLTRSLGDKAREMTDEDRAKVLRLYDDFVDSEYSKIFNNTDFGYWTITVERPLRDGSGEIVRDSRGNPVPDKSFRANEKAENVPFTYGGNMLGEDGKDATIAAFFKNEILPHVPDAWIDYKKTKIGYEIPFTRTFYRYRTPDRFEDLDLAVKRALQDLASMVDDAPSGFPERADRGYETGVAWLGRVPDHWTVGPLATFFEERNDTVSDKDFPPLSVTKGGVVPQLDSAVKTENNDNRKLVRKGDFAINSRSDRKGSSGVSEYDGSVSVVYTVLRMSDAVDPRYAHHLLRSIPFQEEYYRWGNGIVDDLWTTRSAAMKRILMALPPLDEQRRIASFLDARAAEIEAAERLLREAKRRLANLTSAMVTGRLHLGEVAD